MAGTLQCAEQELRDNVPADYLDNFESILDAQQDARDDISDYIQDTIPETLTPMSPSKVMDFLDDLNDFTDDFRDENPDGIQYPDNPYDGGAGDGEDGGDGEGFFDPPDTPLVIDLDGDGIELISLDSSSAYFDIDNDGFAERTGWVAPDDGLLAIDLNGNGTIDGKMELFGDSGSFQDGFQALAALDSNADGLISSLDDSFASLVVWRDLDSDGISDAGELLSVTDLGIAQIDLGAAQINETNAGHDVLLRSEVQFEDGSTTTIDDVFFNVDQRQSKRLLGDDFELSFAASIAPVFYGSGNIASTYVALSERPELVARASDLLELVHAGDISGMMAGFEDYLLDWAGVLDVDPSSRGSYVDARHLEFLEAMYGEGFQQLYRPTGEHRSDPNAAAAPAIEADFDAIVETFAARFIAQSTYTLFMIQMYTSDPEDEVQYNPFASLHQLTLGQSTENRELSGNLTDAIEGLVEATSLGLVSAADVASIISFLRHDLSDDDDAYYIMVETILNRSAETDAAGDIIDALPQSNVLAGTEGDDVLTTGNVAMAVFGNTGDDLLNGGDKSNKYLYFFGDGNDVIVDKDLYGNSGTDTLTFVDVASTEATLIQGASQDLVIALANGETVTVRDHFSDSYDYSVESITFADGVTLGSYQAIRDRSVRDQVALDQDIITGSTYTENYVHHAGDGSYTIAERDLYGNSGTDTLTFVDVASTEATLIQGASQDLVIALANGETVTVRDHFSDSYDYSVESITFADGVTLGSYQAIRDRSVRDQVALDQDIITGSTYTENYVHHAGDGSYTIAERDLYGNSGTDTLTFVDVASTEATLIQGASQDLVIALANGETVTVRDHFSDSYDYSVESITFADGVTLGSYQAIRDRSVRDQVALDQDIITGSTYTENYVHHAGDGSYTIAERDLYGNSGTDTLTFVDVASTEATLIQGASQDLVIALANGETVTVRDHFSDSYDYSVESITFADGVTLGSYQAIRDRSVRDQVALDQDIITGSTYTENYVHHAGDGSYTIAERDLYGNSGTDTLTFVDVASTEATLIQGASQDLVIALANGETVTVRDHFSDSYDYSVESITFADGVTLGSYQAIRDRSVRDQVALDQDIITGSTYTENYVHHAGDGSYTIAERDLYGNSGTDTLTFVDVASTEATLIQGASQDLVIALANGETVTVRDHFSDSYDYSVESITFADGVTLGSYQAIRDRSVRDQVALDQDIITGSTYTENYVHHAGDGSYTIAERDLYGNSGTDTLTFVDVASTEATLIQGASQDLVIALANGETVTVDSYFTSDRDHAVEVISFSDGVSRSVDDVFGATVVDNELLFG